MSNNLGYSFTACKKHLVYILLKLLTGGAGIMWFQFIIILLGLK